MIIGKKLATAILGFSLVLSSALYADGSHNHTKTADTTTNNHMGDHMHEGKMMNHMNEGGMTDAQMKEMHNNHMGDHMHEGKMTNHSNPDGMTDEQMKKMGH